MAKLKLSDIKSGSLVSEVREETIKFWHNGEEFEVDVLIKQLPFGVTDDLLRRMNKGDDVAAEWISKALVDEKGKLEFTQQQVKDKLVQPLANAIFDKVWGLENVKKTIEEAKSKKE
ncbi:phage tail assembly chaperone family protein, TAC [Psychrobacter sp. F1192]|uniref:Phage tail assembly chaperone family protein, TAC n=1 Tax=Psychrobacter coccoides TaxID=2818440 RepID=A0ABS3NJY2_9GAMM|nr:phage tail assembly chaperone family protein, TAC [Psychrobacter coccoides]MBO1529653.1 phage tail assembly chaperone family protein, TAC [Psychrobacter coccoides]